MMESILSWKRLTVSVSRDKKGDPARVKLLDVIPLTRTDPRTSQIVSTVTNYEALVSPSEAFPLVNSGDPLETKTILAKIAVKKGYMEGEEEEP
jgi:hypothetical protein